MKKILLLLVLLLVPVVSAQGSIDVTVCSSNLVEATILIILSILGLVVVWIGIQQKIGFVGLLGAVFLFFLSLQFMSCVVIYGKALMWFSLVLMIYFVGNAIYPRSNPTFG